LYVQLPDWAQFWFDPRLVLMGLFFMVVILFVIAFKGCRFLGTLMRSVTGDPGSARVSEPLRRDDTT